MGKVRGLVVCKKKNNRIELIQNQTEQFYKKQSHFEEKPNLTAL